ncbi:hypothetical protein BU23DRAFT_82601 [Bimuria novae-zelandiae CBS 107.79]|uniref:Uncharacterized protein n=1 Tax=Bimuria novae-zelandiae CBS 107.79 TaxID=1447943 RepID=A0A6A5VF32_9PLEO|nr:hypothetical protein BU23DRAFT_82601 [Bimuria novae-zelandiae CBS 107.79]
MSDLNILVSNGTCYSKAGEKLDESFIPCGNTAFGFQTCCGAGDNCLADNACFGHHGNGYGSDLTYQAGCTDPDYNDDSCPDKRGIDQPWIALTRCDDDEAVWGACSQEGNPSTLQPGSFCSCTEEAQFSPTAFRDAPTLALFAALPTATGESIRFENGHVPSGDPASDSSPAETGSSSAGSPSAGSSGTSGGGSAPSRTNAAGTPAGSGAANSPTGSPTVSPTGSTSGDPSPSSSGSSESGSNGSPSSDPPSSGSSSGLASGAKIGIGVGVALGLLVILAIIGAILLRRRRRRRSQTAAATEVEKGDSKDPAAVAGRVSDATAADPRISDVTGATENTNKVSEADGKPLSGVDKPGVTELDSEAVMELPGQTAHPYDRGTELDGRQVKPASPKPLAELPGSLSAESPPSWVVR